MNLLYNSITIINIDNKKEFFYQKFSKGFNFVRAENRAGKSTLAKSIFYSLGSAIDLDELEDEVKNLATILEFSICNEIYYIVSKIFDKRRTVYLFDSEMELLIQCNKNQKNKSNSNLVLNYEAFSNWVLDKLFNIGWIRFQEKYRSTELISPYLSSIFEFFYIDQSEWGIDFASFDDTQFIERKNLELLIGVFSNKFNENDFNILINSKNLEKKNQKLKLNKDIYKATIREINSRNNIEGFNDIETVNKMKRDFDKHYNDIKDQLKITNILKQKYFQKSLLSKIMSQYSSIKDNFIYMRDNLFPIELPIINSSGKVQKINFEDIISWKSNHELNIKNQKEIKQKITILNNEIIKYEDQIKKIDQKYNELTNKTDDNFYKKDISEEQLEKIFKLNLNINNEIKKINFEIEGNMKEIIEIKRKWDNVNHTNYLLLNELTSKLNSELHKLEQTKKIKYFLNLMNYKSNKLSGSDKIFYHLAQKYVFFDQKDLLIKFPLVIDTPNKEDLSDENWDLAIIEINKISKLTQTIVMSTRNIDNIDNINYIDLSYKAQRELLKSNKYNIPDRISFIFEIIEKI